MEEYSGQYCDPPSVESSSWDREPKGGSDVGPSSSEDDMVAALMNGSGSRPRPRGTE